MCACFYLCLVLLSKVRKSYEEVHLQSHKRLLLNINVFFNPNSKKIDKRNKIKLIA